MFATLTSAGLGLGLDPDRRGRELARDPARRRSRARSGSSSLCRSCSPRWSSTAGSALRRVEPASATVATPAPRRRTSSSGLAPRNAASGVPTQKQKQDGNSSRRAPKSGRRIVRRPAPRPRPRARAPPSRARRRGSARRPRRPPPRSGAEAGTLLIARRAGRAAGRASAAGRRAARRAGARAARETRSVGSPPGDALSGQPASRRRARSSESSGRTSSAGGNDDQCGARAAVGDEREAAGPDRPGAGRQLLGLVARSRPRHDLGAPRRRRRRTGSARARRPRAAEPSAASAKPSRSGCSQQNQRSRGQPRGEHRGARIGDLDRPRDAAPAAASPRPLEQRVELGEQRSAAITPSRLLAPSRDLVLGPRLGDRDLARARHLDQAVRADHALERVDLVLRAGDLDRQRAARDVDDLRLGRSRRTA